MVKLYKTIAFPFALTLIMIFSSNVLFAQQEFIITGGVQNPGVNNSKNYYRTDTLEPRKINNRVSSMTPFIKFRKVVRKQYLDIAVYWEISETHNWDVTKPEDNGKYIVTDRLVTNNVPMLEVGKGLKYPVKNSFITLGLNGLVGYNYNPKLTDTKTTYTFGDNNSVQSVTTRQDSPKFLQLGLATDITYNQKLTDKIFINIEPKVRYRVQFNSSKPSRNTTTVLNGNETSVSTLEYVEYDRKITNFQFFPTLGLSGKF